MTRWRDRGLAVLAGLAAALAHPPFGLLPGLLGYGLLMWLLDRVDAARPGRSAFFRGWLAGTAYFAVGTWWVSEAFLVDAAEQGWMAPFAVALLAAGLGLFWGVGAWLYRLARPAGPVRVLAFAAALSLLEWLRGHVFTGFPWNLPGETWAAGSAPSQFAAVVGAYGLTWITVAIAAAPGLLPSRRRGDFTACGLALAGLAGLYLYGLDIPMTAAAPQGPKVRIVQADVEQAAKYDRAIFTDIVGRYVTLTAQPPAQGARPDIVIWPEGAIPASANDYLAEGTWTRAAIENALVPGQVLMVGAYRVQPGPAGDAYYNSLMVLRRTERGLDMLGVYDKHRLVPFGEYMPADGLMSAIGFKAMTHMGEGFSPGPPPVPMRIPGLPVFQPLICYESLFPGFLRLGARAAGVRPQVIVNVSNDSWYGKTSGPLQNLNISSYRAIEEGVPMLRSTPTGVSAIIDSKGRINHGAQLGLGSRGVIDEILPKNSPPTIYFRLGDSPFWLFLLISGLFCALPCIRRARKGRDILSPFSK
jgi:apolipoprotein N-acyltransferase